MLINKNDKLEGFIKPLQTNTGTDFKYSGWMKFIIYWVEYHYWLPITELSLYNLSLRVNLN